MQQSTWFIKHHHLRSATSWMCWPLRQTTTERTKWKESERLNVSGGVMEGNVECYTELKWKHEIGLWGGSLSGGTWLQWCKWCLIAVERVGEKWKPVACRNPGSNRGHLDLQSNALPTELLRRRGFAQSHPFTLTSISSSTIHTQHTTNPISTSTQTSKF